MNDTKEITREQVTKDILELSNNNILAELPTSMGKTKIALEWLKKYHKENTPILIAVPTNVLKQNWIMEIGKWNCEYLLKDITFTTYVSLPKHIAKQSWAEGILDEVHHLSSRCIDAIQNSDNTFNKVLGLSATVSITKKYELKETFDNLYIYSVSLRDAIDSDILPDPKVLLLPLKLDNINKSCTIYNRYKKTSYVASPLQFYNDMSGLIDWYKKKHMDNRMLRASLDRLIWLSEQKEQYTKEILSILKNYRTLTFCSSIAQTKKLGKYCINSKNKQVNEYIELFNLKKIKHITACQMLNEGISLSDCRIGIFNMLNSSNLIQTQKNGRILRHQSPILIIPYFINTVEERNVNKMLENYNKDLIKTTTINQLKNEICN